MIKLIHDKGNMRRGMASSKWAQNALKFMELSQFSKWTERWPEGRLSLQRGSMEFSAENSGSIDKLSQKVHGKYRGKVVA